MTKTRRTMIGAFTLSLIVAILVISAITHRRSPQRSVSGIVVGVQ